MVNMTQRISSGLSTILNPFGPNWAGSAEKTKEARPVGEQVQDALFGKKKPQELEADDFEDVAETLKILDRYKRKFVKMIGDPEDEYTLQLANGTIAMIDAHGKIFVGLAFLRTFKSKLEVILGALAHEIGHRPRRWAEYKAKQDLTAEELEQLCRYEETRADLFAGRALAEVDMSPEPMIAFLQSVEEGPHPDYFPASMRADVIREGYREQKSLATTRKRLWPELDREVSPKMHVGDF
jgi:hypothetical protein